MIRGAQPETVKDYDVYLDGTKVLSIRGNYLRKRVHHLEKPIEAKILRLDVLSTQGLNTARVYEIRAYE
jgi:hypothetical protein